MTNNNRFLFRAWDIERNVMLEEFNIFELPWDYDDGCISDEQKDTLLGQYPDKDNLVLLQFTGLTDKNGVKIFEGDIVRWFSSEDEGGEFDLGVIEFVAGGFKLTFENSYGGFQAEISEEFEVIGNIYQNKDLLDKKDA